MKQSIINWQTGEPKESGSFLVTFKDGKVYQDYFILEDFWGNSVWMTFGKNNVIAWCKLSDIEPYKEE